MTQTTTAGVQAAGTDLVNASKNWVAAFGAAPLDAGDAADLVAGALRVTQAVARAARSLSWQTPDAFEHAMRQAEQEDDR